MIFECCTIDIAQRFRVVSDCLFCWSSPWQPESRTNKSKRHVIADTGRSSIGYWSLEAAALLVCLFPSRATHTVRTQFLTHEYFWPNWCFEINTSSRVCNSGMGGGIGYCCVVWRLPESEMHKMALTQV